MIREKLQKLFLILFKWLSVQEIIGLENVPESGGCILVFNHLGLVDAPFLFITIKRDDFTALVAKKYQNRFFISWLVNKLSGIWLDRDNPDPRALKAAISHLKAGGMLAISPEGTRSNSGLLPAKPGVAYLAAKAGVPLLPVALWGTEGALGVLLRFHRPRLFMRIGPAFILPALDRSDREAALQRGSDEIMIRIASMLPEKYRGVYRDAPDFLPVLD